MIEFDSPRAGPVILGAAAALAVAVLLFMTGGEGSMPEPLTTLPDTVYPAKEGSADVDP